MRVVLLRPSGDHSVQGLVVREAGSRGGKTRVVVEFRVLHDLAERLPLSVIVYSDGQPVVLASGWVHARGGQMRITIPHPLLAAPVHRVVQQRRGEKVQR